MTPYEEYKQKVEDIRIKYDNKKTALKKAESLETSEAFEKLKQYQKTCTHHITKQKKWDNYHTGEVFVDTYCKICNKYLSRI